MKMHNRTVFALAAFTLSWIAEDREALALDPQYVGAPKAVGPSKKSGWDGELSLGASTSFGSTSFVVGKPDGVSFAFGLTLTSGLDFNRDVHEWRNTLSLGETFARTPAVDAFVKTQDLLAFESIYLVKIRPIPWFGPFVRSTLEIALFDGVDVRATDTAYSITRPDGTTRAVTSQRLRLSDAFKPILLKQSVGAFAKPVAEKEVEVEVRLGVGAREIIADGQIALADDAATKDVVEAKDLTSYNQAGGEITATVRGALYGGKVTYKAGAEVMFPFARSNQSDGKGVLEAANVELGVKISFKLVSWASLDYEFKGVRLPQTLDKFQLQNNLLLTFALALVSRDASSAAKAP